MTSAESKTNFHEELHSVESQTLSRVFANWD